MMEQATLAGFAPVQLPWPYVEILEILNHPRIHRPVHCIWHNVKQNMPLEPGRRGKKPEPPPRPPQEFFVAIGRLYRGGIIEPAGGSRFKLTTEAWAAGGCR